MIPGWAQIIIGILIFAVVIWNSIRASSFINLILRATALGVILALLMLVAPMISLGGTFDMRLVVQIIQFVVQTLMFSIPVYAIKLLVQKIRSMKNDVV